MHKILTVTYAVGIILILSISVLLLLTIFPIPGLDMDARVVQSGSMEPAIGTGSIVFIRPADSYTEGDIITFRRGGQETPTTHRIIGSRVESGVTFFTTKGDANEVQDMEEVRESEVIGTVRFTVPLVGHLVDFARKPLGFVLLIAVPAIAIGFDEVRKITREVKRIRSKKRRT